MVNGKQGLTAQRDLGIAAEGQEEVVCRYRGVAGLEQTHGRGATGRGCPGRLGHG
jgi:hypothetical protein